MGLGRLRYQQFHVSYSLLSVAIGALMGLVIAQDMTLTAPLPFLFASLLLLLGGLKSNRWWALAAALLAGILFGIVRGSSVGEAYAGYGSLVGKPVKITGIITSDAKSIKSDRQQLSLSGIRVDGVAYIGEVYVTSNGTRTLKRGDTVTVTGKLREGFAVYAAVIVAGKIVAIERGPDTIRDIRERFGETIKHQIAEPMASLGLGFVVGQRSTLPETLDDQLKVVGLTHIVVASGYNLTILVRFIMRLLSRHSRYLTLAGSLVAITLFVLFSGFSPSMNRAVIITGLGLLAWYVGRRFHPVLLILYVAAVTGMFNPMYVWADLGWYLSFLAFTGILVVAPLVIEVVYRDKDLNSFVQLVIETLSAEIMALPLIAFAFSTFPIFGLLANVLVGPFIPAAMALTALTGVIGMMSVSLAAVVALPTTILIAYMIAVVEWLAAIPWAQAGFDISFGQLLLWYAGVAFLALAVVHRRGYNFRSQDRRLEL